MAQNKLPSIKHKKWTKTGKKDLKRLRFNETKLDRLGKKLRENLQKRKLQARARGEQKN